MERPTKSVTLPPCVEAQDTLVWRGGLAYFQSCLQSLLLSSLARDSSRWQLTQPRARHAGYIWALECHKEIVRISSLCVQSQSHLKLKDKPVCCLLPRSAGNTGRRIKRPSSLPVSGLSEQLNGKKWRHAGIQTERWEATGEWGDDAWVASG